MQSFLKQARRPLVTERMWQQERGGIMEKPSIWDDREAFDDCSKCRVRFRRFEPRHNCRACGIVVCGDSGCSEKSTLVPDSWDRKGKPGPHRVCAHCRYLLMGGFAMAADRASGGTELPPGQAATDRSRSQDLLSPSVPASAQAGAAAANASALARRTAHPRPPVLAPVATVMVEPGQQPRSPFTPTTPRTPAEPGSPSSPGTAPPRVTVALQFLQTCGMPNCTAPRVSRGFCAEHTAATEMYLAEAAQWEEVVLGGGGEAGQSQGGGRGSKGGNGSSSGSTADLLPGTGALSALPAAPSSPSQYATGQGSGRNVTSGVGRPFNVKHVAHVDRTLTWQGENLEEAFRLVELLGTGSFGEVWRAVHTRAHFEIAVKMVSAGSVEDAQSFQDEIAVLRATRHPNVVSYYGCWGPDSKGRLWIMMDLCEVGAVPELLELTRTQLTEAQLAYVLASTLLALDYLHSKGINHRDVKGANILVTRQGVIKLTDFGVSQKLAPRAGAGTDGAVGDGGSGEGGVGVGGSEEEMMERDTDLVGTPLWLAPEMIRGRCLGFRADVWSVGITAIELAEGVPLADLPRYRVLRAIVNRPPPELQRPFWSQQFRSFVGACLVKDPHQRATTKELLSHPFLQAAVTSVGECLVSSASAGAGAGNSPLGPIIKKFFFVRERRQSTGLRARVGSRDRMQQTYVVSPHRTDVPHGAGASGAEAAAAARNRVGGRGARDSTETAMSHCPDRTEDNESTSASSTGTQIRAPRGNPGELRSFETIDDSQAGSVCRVAAAPAARYLLTQSSRPDALSTSGGTRDDGDALSLPQPSPASAAAGERSEGSPAPGSPVSAGSDGDDTDGAADSTVRKATPGSGTDARTGTQRKNSQAVSGTEMVRKQESWLE